MSLPKKETAYSYEKYEEEEEYPPNVLRFSDAEEIRNTKDYVVKDLYFPNEKGDIVFTTTITNLHPGRQTMGHAHDDHHEIYQFQQGNGLILLNAYAVHVKPGMYILVPKNTHHKVINTSTVEMTFLTFFPSNLVRPEKITKSSLIR